MSDCKLLGNWYSYLIQFSLGIVAFGSLYVKRKYENPKRPKKIWILDISKQIIGGLFAHLCNMLIAYILGNNNPCLWYFINYFIDVFVGVILCYYMLKIVNQVANKYPKYNIYETGLYYSPQHTIQEVFIKQLLLWIFIIFVTKLILFTTIILPCKNQLYNLGNAILAPVSNNSNLELFVIMILFPLIMNIIQYWIQDNILKGKIDTLMPYHNMENN